VDFVREVVEIFIALLEQRWIISSVTSRWAAITIYWDRASVKTASVELQSTPVDTFWPQNAFSHNLYANYFGIIFSHQRRLTFNSFGDALLSSMWLLLLPEANRHFINISQK